MREIKFVPSELRQGFVISPIIDILVLRAHFIGEAVVATIHGESTTRKLFAGHDRRIRETEILHHVCLFVQLVRLRLRETFYFAVKDAK